MAHNLATMNSPTPEQSKLVEEVCAHNLRIRRLMLNSEGCLDAVALDERRQLGSRLWNEYIYPRFLPVYLELFPNTEGRCASKDPFGDIRRMAITYCEWVRRNGFFHAFDGSIYFLRVNTFVLCDLLIEGPSFVRLSLEAVAQTMDCLANRDSKTAPTSWLGKLLRIVGRSPGSNGL